MRIWKERIHYEWEISKKENIIITILFFIIISTLVYLIVDMRRIKIEHAREVWELKQYYRQKEKEQNFDRRMLDKEFDVETEFDFYYNRELDIR